MTSVIKTWQLGFFMALSVLVNHILAAAGTVAVITVGVMFTLHLSGLLGIVMGLLIVLAVVPYLFGMAFTLA